MIVAFRAAGRAVFLYGFAKNDRNNIEEDALQTLRTVRTGLRLRPRLSGGPWTMEI
ncbi:MAG TPA: type II toxin-antitoxin system RelE/ParE family toxin [Acetobacteraceae bacterium]|nr:type II toxin-antitoxin system RelE/ParE family toxin [Acetobacteraceae bacterium]